MTIGPVRSGLFTDLYELTMAQGYFVLHPDRRAVFDMFFRSCPFDGGYTVCAGIAPLLESLSNLRFSDDEIEYLDGLGTFDEDFLDYLAGFRFKGNVYAVPEGSLLFPDEPMLRIHGNIIEAQIVESLVLNTVNFQTLIATKASRIVDVAGETKVLEFGLRRSQGADGSISAVRAAAIGGVDGTSNVLAGKLFDIPVMGTMAHSWIMSFESELESFRAYARQYPDNCILLVDTYDTIESGIPNAIEVLSELKSQGRNGTMGIRLDSGDLDYLSTRARSMLDEANLEDALIVASNQLDERVIEQIRSSGDNVDAWGVGTKLATGWGDPALDGVYKLAAVSEGSEIQPRMKLSDHPEKTTNPGVKNVLRFVNDNESPLADLVCLEEEIPELLRQVKEHRPIRLNHPVVEYEGITLEDYSTARPLLQPMMKEGKPIGRQPSVEELSRRRRSEVKKLHPTFRRLLNPHVYKVSLSDKLALLKMEMIRNRGRGNDKS
ncbi:nicotinate phosphoribosyltransferase [Candidatus Fermentibacteria bacterium]|nr:nicotinate phosphoribosyltransferase [Candidatus Fermentibacteria bacterium]